MARDHSGADGYTRMRLMPNSKYANSQKHMHNQKIIDMFKLGLIDATTPMIVTHKPTCAIFFGWDNYCNCDPYVGRKIIV